MNKIPGVAILGCGLIGQKRSKTLAGAKLVVCADVDEKRESFWRMDFPVAKQLEIGISPSSVLMSI